jgi:hypothetical protein
MTSDDHEQPRQDMHRLIDLTGSVALSRVWPRETELPVHFQVRW